MATIRMENWDAGDFGRSFRQEAQRSKDEHFRARFLALADAIEPLDREFCHETVRCGRDLSSVMDGLQSIAARMGYCVRPRGFDESCAALYRDVDNVIDEVQSLRDACFV